MLTLTVRPYYRPFCQPLQTHHGLWEKRQGLILRFEDDQGRVSFGEVAPIPWFGTETLAMAWDFCAQWPRRFSLAAIATIPETLPACQFGFAGAQQHGNQPNSGNSHDWDTFTHGDANCWSSVPTNPICALLPTGAAALDAWSTLWQKGHRTFKWKIGVAPIQQELRLFHALVNALPANAHLRLDANGGLVAETAEQWLLACDTVGSQVEFLEQPLSPDRILNWVHESAENYRTAIALDESVATLKQLEAVHQRLQNRVVYVVKPAIAGFPNHLKALCTQHSLDVVFSSALETPVGRRAVLRLAQELGASGVPRRALGFGVGHWFQDTWDTLSEEALWQQL